jgi:hypothetical protein
MVPVDGEIYGVLTRLPRSLVESFSERGERTPQESVDAPTRDMFGTTGRRGREFQI